LIARPADTTLLAKTSSIQVKSRRRESQSNVLSSKLNSIKIKEKPENDHKINESQVEERLSKGTYSNHPFYDRLTLENRHTKEFRFKFSQNANFYVGCYLLLFLVEFQMKPLVKKCF